jgi:hypothetical protein
MISYLTLLTMSARSVVTYFDDPLIAQRLSTLFSELRERSPGADESRTLIAQLAEATRD